jgi:hypothetical protein
MGRAGPLAQVDQLVGGLLDAQPLGQRGRQQQAALAMAWVSSKQMSSWSGVWEDCIEKVPSWQGSGSSRRRHSPRSEGLSHNQNQHHSGGEARRSDFNHHPSAVSPLLA